MVKAMKAAGCSAEQIVETVCAYECDADAHAAARREKDRERKRAERAEARAAASAPVQAVQQTARTIADSMDSGSPRLSSSVPPMIHNSSPLPTSILPLPQVRERPEIVRPSEGGEGFARFWQAMPSPTPAAKAAALAAFARLATADQAAAIAAAGRYASDYSAKPTTHPLSPVRFLRERCFEGYGPPRAGPGEAPAVFVRVETPQWRAWQAHRGPPIPLNREGTGWHFPTEWPPARECSNLKAG